MSCVFITLLCNNQFFPHKFITHKDLNSLLYSFPSCPAVVCGVLWQSAVFRPTGVIIIIIIIFFNDKLTIATYYKIKDKYKISNVGLATESSNTYKNQYKSLYKCFCMQACRPMQVSLSDLFPWSLFSMSEFCGRYIYNCICVK